MSSLVLTDAKILIAGHDLSGSMNAVALEYAAEMKDDTRFGHTTRVNKGGIKRVVGSAAGNWDAAATTSVDPVLFARVGMSDVPVVISPDGGQVGEVAYLFQAIHSEYSLDAQVGELLPFEVSMEGAGGHPLVRGKMFHNATVSGDVTGTAIQLGALSSTQYLYAALHVMAGDGDFVVKVQSDNASNFPSATDRITFTSVANATAVASEWKRVAGAVTDDWWRIVATNPSGRTFAVALGIR